MTTIHRSRQTTGPVRVAPVDIAHSRHRSAFVLGPVPIPDAEVATDRIRRLAAVGPAARIGLRPSMDLRSRRTRRRRLVGASDRRSLRTAAHRARGARRAVARRARR
ncbi:hypothetical protein [Gordonia bronchialis]|uniref:hypothetical protein n=1 Tax=Gordonia bronchialis TaxID=2054 RepID=UPI00227175A6|nr:hypothetical protein [Gordonia bronchialis]